jgi:hypothetical protein
VYLIKRVSKVPNSSMRISVDQPDGGDGGFQEAGVFYFAPKGQDGDQHQVSEHAAQVIMWDPTLAEHFECQPPLPRASKADKAAAVPEPGSPAHPADVLPSGPVLKEHPDGPDRTKGGAVKGSQPAGKKKH